MDTASHSISPERTRRRSGRPRRAARAGRAPRRALSRKRPHARRRAPLRARETSPRFAAGSRRRRRSSCTACTASKSASRLRPSCAQPAGTHATCKAGSNAWTQRGLPTMRKRPDLGVTGEQPVALDHARAPQDRPHRLSLAGAPLHRPGAPNSSMCRRSWCSRKPSGWARSPTTSPARRSRTTASSAASMPCCVPSTCRSRRLSALARIVRGADTDRPGSDAAIGRAAGDLARAVALVRERPRMLDAALPVYDALYAWCRGEGRSV